MKRVILVILTMLAVSVHATTVEQEQRFKYYYYEAVRLFQDADYTTAYHLFEFLDQLNPNDPSVNLYLGIFHDGFNDPEGALDYYRRAYELYPDEYWINYVVSLFRRGEEADRAKGIAILEEVSLSQPDNSDVWDNLRQAYTATKNYTNALHAQDELDRLEGYSQYSAINRYRIQLMRHDVKAALCEIDRYLVEDPTNLQFLIWRTEIYEATKQKPQVLAAAYEQVLKQDPRNATVLNNYAYLLSNHHGDLSRAEVMSQRALQQEPQNPTFIDTYAWILYKKKEWALAEMYIRRAISCSEDEVNPEIAKHALLIMRKAAKAK